MDCSVVVAESLDSLWFYSNVLTFCRTETEDSVPSLTDDQVAPPPPPPIQAKEEDLHRPITPLCVLNQENESQVLGVQDLDLDLDFTPGCYEIGESSSAPVSQRATEKRKKKKNKFGIVDGRKQILGAVELGFGVKQVCGALNEMLTDQHLPPFDDDVVMKKHIKSWAYAVACSVKVN